MEWMLMPLTRYADFSGRSRRMEFWMWQLAKLLVSVVIATLFVILAGGAVMSVGNDPTRIVAAGGAILTLWMLVMIFWVAILVPDIAVTVRRLHDSTGPAGGSSLRSAPILSSGSPSAWPPPPAPGPTKCWPARSA